MPCLIKKCSKGVSGVIKYIRSAEMRMKSDTNMSGRCLVILALACLLLQAPGCKDNTMLNIPNDEIEQICANVISCGPSWGEEADPSAMTTCVDSMTWYQLEMLGYVLIDEHFECYRSAGSDCDALMRCGNGGHGVESCDDATFEKQCEGNRVVDCIEGKKRYIDCSEYGHYLVNPICSVDEADGAVGCVGEPCSGTSSRCSSNTVAGCEGGSSFQLHCSLFEMICEELPSGGATCRGTGPVCAEDIFVSRCDGDQVIYCAGGREVGMDCGLTLGPDYTCLADPVEGTAGCVPAREECNIYDHIDTCDGPFLVFCRSGRLDRIDCRELGYGGCVGEAGAAFCR